MAKLPTRCIHCEYDLHGLAPGPRGTVFCPECGGSTRPHTRPGTQIIPGLSRVLLMDVAVFVALFWLLCVAAPITFVELCLYLPAVLALIPITGVISFRRARRYRLMRKDAMEEWVLSMIITVPVPFFTTILAFL